MEKTVPLGISYHNVFWHLVLTCIKFSHIKRKHKVLRSIQLNWSALLYYNIRTVEWHSMPWVTKQCCVPYRYVELFSLSSPQIATMKRPQDSNKQFQHDLSYINEAMTYYEMRCAMGLMWPSVEMRMCTAAVVGCQEPIKVHTQAHCQPMMISMTLCFILYGTMFETIEACNHCLKGLDARGYFVFRDPWSFCYTDLLSVLRLSKTSFLLGFPEGLNWSLEFRSAKVATTKSPCLSMSYALVTECHWQSVSVLRPIWQRRRTLWPQQVR